MSKGERLPSSTAGRDIWIDFEGERLPAKEGEPIATALLAAGVDVFSRGVKYHRARGAYCLSGRCSHCLMRVDGEPNVTTCTTPTRDGQKIHRQNAFPSVNLDVFATIDWMYPRGLDHHSMFAGVPVVEKVVAKVAREMAGLGTLPDVARADGATYAELETGVLVVGAGPAGLAAARAAAEAGVPTTLIDEQPHPGGRLQTGLPFGLPDGWVDEQVEAIRNAGGHVLTHSLAFGYYREEGPMVAVRTKGRRLLVIRPKATVVAAGASEPLAPFPNNDLPGVYAGRALARMITRDRYLPGTRAVVAGEGPEREALAALLRGNGCEVVATVGLRKGNGPWLVRARGRSGVAGAVLADASGAEKKIRCDLIALAGQSSALVDLARHAGAHVAWKNGFGVVVDETFATGVPGVFACGEVVGPADGPESVRQGRLAGTHAATFATGVGQ